MSIFNFWKREERASPENPNTPLSNPALWLTNLFGGGTGPAVNQDTAVYISAVWACLQAVSAQLASVPFQVHKEDETGTQKGLSHPLYATLHDSPNPELTSFAWRELMIVHLMLWGRAYSWIERNAAGRPLYLWPLLPWNTVSERVGGDKLYRTLVNDREVMIPMEDIIHLQGMGFDGIDGKNPMEAMSKVLKIGLSGQDFAVEFFGSGAMLSGVLQSPVALDDDAYANIRQSWNDTYSGTMNAGKTAILEQGLEYKPLSAAPKDAQITEQQKEVYLDVARFFGVPPHVIGLLDNATFSNIEQQSIEYVTQTLRPMAVRIEQEINRKLFTNQRGARFFVKFNLEGLLRGDLKSRFEAYNTGIQAGFMTRAEAREFEDWNPIEGLDKPLVPLNMSEEGDEPDESNDSDEEPDEEDAPEDSERSSTMIMNACEALTQMEYDRILRLIEKPECEKKIVDFYVDHGLRIANRLVIDKKKAYEYCQRSCDSLAEIVDIADDSVRRILLNGWHDDRLKDLTEVSL